MRHAGDVKNRVLLLHGVEAGVIAKRAFHAQFVQLHIAFENDLRIRRHFEIDGFALDQLDCLLAQKSCNDELFDLWRCGHNGGEGESLDRCRSPPQLRAAGPCSGPGRSRVKPAVVPPAVSAITRTRAALASPEASATRRRPQPLAQVLRGHLLPLPVHTSGLSVVDLHAVHAHVPFSAL